MFIMKDAFIKFCQQINFDITYDIKDSRITKVDLIEKNNKNFIDFQVKFFSIPYEEQLEEFSTKSISFFSPSEVIFDFHFINKNYSKERVINFISFGIRYLFKKNIFDYIKNENIDFDINQNELNFNFESIIDLTNFKNDIDIDKILKLFNINDLKINILNSTMNVFDSKIKKDVDTLEIEYKKMIKQRDESKALKEHSNKITQHNTNYNSRNKRICEIEIKDFYDTHEQFIQIKGKVFDIDKIITKTNLTIVSFFITDNEEAIVAKYYIPEGGDDKFSFVKKDMNIIAIGEKKMEYNGNSYWLHLSKIEEVKQEERKDEAKDKRIEFSLRTSMSAMDGFMSPENILKYFKKFGHEAVAFTDLQNIQAFPDIYNNAKKIGIKPIYGCTFSVISKFHDFVLNLKHNSNLKKEKYVIFDLETTSLNPRSGEIIEFGAVIVENQTIIKTIQFFVKPSKPISLFTTELTGISQKMLDEQSKFTSQKEAIAEILNIFNDATLVAHNASFDIGFINEKMNQFGFGKLKNQIIDTLQVAKYIFPISASYRLEVVCKKLDIIYDPTIAHRADYDAKVLEQVWIKMIDILELKSITTFEQVYNIDEKWINEKKFSYDLTIYAKNQKGIKQLFELVSKSLTTNYFGGPRLFEEELEKIDRSNLLIGPASINTKLVDVMQTGTKEKLKNEIRKWDFIGIPSPHLFSHLIARESFTKEELYSMLSETIKIANDNNKIVIAIGDVRYFDDEDKIAHTIYINTKGLEGKRHHLYKYNEHNPKYPNQKILSTNEMINEFKFLNDDELSYKIVVENTQYLNTLFDDNIEIIKSKLYPPKFDNSEKKLVELVYENAHKIYGDELPELIKKRIERELEPINKYGFSVVYWISQKLVSKSLTDGYLVGSRGSVGSSIVATLSGITEVNPLIPHYVCKQCKFVEFVENAKTTSGFDLPSKLCSKCNIELDRNGQTIPFETFLGFDGDKVPDIDLNFSGDYQPIIHQEVRRLFGEDHTFRAGTISTVAAKTAFGFVKKYFEENNITKSNHYAAYLAKKIEGSKRTTGQHPGGIIIIPKEFDVEDFTPINYPANDISSNWKTTHFDFHAIHDNVLKLDLLGHDDPTAIRQLQKLTNVKMEDVSFSDEKVIKLFSSTEPLGIKPEDINGEKTGVLGIPEFGTKFVRRMLHVAKPTSFNDLINISGLSHGTDVWTGNAEELIKQGKTLNEVISCRDDIMVYLMKKGIDPSLSFQIMEKVRKGKGLTTEDEKHLKENNIEQWYINSLNKIKYMFPKAHATAYVMMAWRIAWFKIYYPLEYYATFFTVRSDVFDLEGSVGSKQQIEARLNELEKKQSSNKATQKENDLITVFEIINEMSARGIKISNIDLYKSDSTEWKIDYENKSLIPPFVVLDGLGEAAAKSIIEARKEKEFTSKDNLLKRTQINKTVLEKMEKLGILKDLETTDQMKLF